MLHKDACVPHAQSGFNELDASSDDRLTLLLNLQSNNSDCQARLSLEKAALL